MSRELSACEKETREEEKTVREILRGKTDSGFLAHENGNSKNNPEFFSL